jgi:integrase
VPDHVKAAPSFAYLPQIDLRFQEAFLLAHGPHHNVSKRTTNDPITGHKATGKGSLDELISAKSDEYVFTTRLGEVANNSSLSRAFNALLDELDLKVGADGKERTLYSWRHYYITRDLERGVGTHVLSKQVGTSTPIVDKHYSKYSPLINAEMHSGRLVHKKEPKAAKNAGQSVVDVAFRMLGAGTIAEAELIAAIGVERNGYVVTEEIGMKALAAKNDGLISAEMLLRILNG